MCQKQIVSYVRCVSSRQIHSILDVLEVDICQMPCVRSRQICQMVDVSTVIMLDTRCVTSIYMLDNRCNTNIYYFRCQMCYKQIVVRYMLCNINNQLCQMCQKQIDTLDLRCVEVDICQMPYVLEVDIYVRWKMCKRLTYVRCHMCQKQIDSQI